MFSKDAIANKIKEGINSFYKQKEVIAPKELVGVSVTATEISAAHVVVNAPNDIAVKSYDYSVADSNESKREFLAKYVMDYHLDGMPTSYVLPVSAYNLSMIETPKSAQQEFKQELRAALGEFIAYPVEEAVIDAFHLPLKRVSDNKKVMYVASIQARLIPGIESLINGSGLLLQYIDIQELCLRNIACLHPENSKGSLFAYFDEDRVQVVLLDKGTIVATRQVEIPLKQLVIAGSASADAAMEYNEEELLDTISSDLQRSIDFCSNVFRDSPAHSVILAPSVIDIDKVYEYLKKNIGLSVHKMQLGEIIKFQQADSNNRQAKCLLAIAACLRYLPEQLQKDEKN